MELHKVDGIIAFIFGMIGGLIKYASVIILDIGFFGRLFEAGVTAMVVVRNTYTTAPTGGSWTLSGNGNFNNLKIEHGSPAALDVNPDQYLDFAFIEAAVPETELTVPGTPSDKRHTTLGVGMITLNTKFKNHFIK